MKLVEYVPDYILRSHVKIGQVVTILRGSHIKMQIPATGQINVYTLTIDRQVTVTNFLPGYTDVYTPHAVHNHQVVWVVNDVMGEPCEYQSTDINNVKEVRDA